jgi:hypothetical protein
MSEAEIHVGDVITFERTIKDQDGNIVNVSSAAEKKLIFRRPNNLSTEYDASLSTDGTDGKISYKLTIDQAGDWSWQGFVRIGTDEWHAGILTFTAKRNLA